MIGVGAQPVNRLSEADLDLEAMAVDLDDFEGLERDVGGQEEDDSAVGMLDEDEADDSADGPPEEIRHAITEGDAVLAIDGAGGGLEGRVVLCEVLEADLSAVQPRSAATSACWLRGGVVGDGI